MKIEILLFGITSDLVGLDSLEFKIPKESTVKHMKDKLIKKFPSLKNINDFAIAINEEYAIDTDIINKKDVIAIIPPVSGG